jgi:TRAP-type uncharacterized transport system fused permease subunit
LSRAPLPVRLTLVVAGFLLVYPERWSRTVGFGLIVVSLIWQLVHKRRAIA